MHDAHVPSRAAAEPRRGTPPARAPAPAIGMVRTYERYAPLYDLLFGQVLEPGRRAMTRVATALQPGSLLEVGVGTGLALPGYPPTTRVTGIDLSPEMLARAQGRAREHQLDVTLRLMDAEHMDFADDSFDCVTLPYVLSVTSEPARLVAEARRVCKPDGHVIVVNHFSGSRFWWLMERAVRPLADRVGFRSDFSFDDHIRGFDWELLSVEPVNLFALSRLVVLRNAKRGATRPGAQAA
jgi:phosphatidylethanolamine/phosphatidyl-N-methylethanolamine N-methyltransferase